MVNDDRTAGLVLPAGAGSRYGRPKILVDGWLTGGTRAPHDGGCGSAAVVTGAAAVRRLLDWTGDRLGRAVFSGRPGHPVVLPRGHVRALLDGLRDEDGAGPYLRPGSHVEVECGDLASGEDVDVDSAEPSVDTMEGSDP